VAGSAKSFLAHDWIIGKKIKKIIKRFREKGMKTQERKALKGGKTAKTTTIKIVLTTTITKKHMLYSSSFFPLY